MNLNGVWRPNVAKLGGNEFDGPTLQSIELTIKDDNFTAEMSGQSDTGKFKLDESKSPTAMDIVNTQGVNAGRMTLAIVKLANDNLTICYSLQKGIRPRDFTSTPENNHFLVVYKKDTAY